MLVFCNGKTTTEKGFSIVSWQTVAKVCKYDWFYIVKLSYHMP